MNISSPNNNNTVLENIVCKNYRKIVWEIQRPLLNKFLKNIDILNLDQELAIQNIIEELSQIIKDKEFILNLLNIINSVEMEHITELYEDIVTKFLTRNQIIVLYNPILTACTESNTAVYHLGSEQ